MPLFENPKHVRYALYGLIALVVALVITKLAGPGDGKVCVWIAIAGGAITWAIWSAGHRIAQAIDRTRPREPDTQL